MINCEIRATPAADLVMDCSDLSRFDDGSIDHIYSHAFFEHLYFNQRQPCLDACRRVLKKNGMVLFIGLPDLKIIAESYLKKAELASGWSFDAHMVYRYTHGDPEKCSNWWLEQLHKTLFDSEVISSLLEKAGFDRWVIFNYRFVGEDIPLNLGFVAWSGDMTDINLKELLAPHQDRIASLDDVRVTAEYFTSI
jgi:predicted SAM-dependent methyltransferase